MTLPHPIPPPRPPLPPRWSPVRANEARALSEKVLTDVGESLLARILLKVGDRARMGEFDLANPFAGLEMADTQRRKLVEILVSLGYRFEEVPGGQCDPPFTILHW